MGDTNSALAPVELTMIPNSRSCVNRALSSLVVLSVTAGAAALAAPAASAATTVSTRTSTVVPTDDAFVQTDAPNRTTGSMTKLVASNVAGVVKTGLLKVSVPAAPAGGVLTRAELVLTSDRALPGRVDVRGVASTSWDEAGVTKATAPAVGAVVATATPAAGARRVGADVTQAVAAGRVRSFAVTVPSGTAAFASSEAAAADAPQLVLTWTVTTTTPDPVQPGEPRATLFGTSNHVGVGETALSAWQRRTQAYGQAGVARVFFGGTPGSWSAMTKIYGTTPLSVSFHADPRAVLSGRNDAMYRSFFTGAPKDRRTFWTYYHEPENDPRVGWTTAEYRAAWEHIDRIADSVANPQLRSTLVLMCWSLNPASGRNWKDWYNPEAVDVLGWDCYNPDNTTASYISPAALFGPAKAAAASVGRPWAVTEWGSRVQGGNLKGRADWVRASSRWGAENGAVFMAYWDAKDVTGHDFRLADTAAIAAQRSVQLDQNPLN